MNTLKIWQACSIANVNLVQEASSSAYYMLIELDFFHLIYIRHDHIDQRKLSANIGLWQCHIYISHLSVLLPWAEGDI